MYGAQILKYTRTYIHKINIVKPFKKEHPKKVDTFLLYMNPFKFLSSITSINITIIVTS